MVLELVRMWYGWREHNSKRILWPQHPPTRSATIQRLICVSDHYIKAGRCGSGVAVIWGGSGDDDAAIGDNFRVHVVEHKIIL